MTSSNMYWCEPRWHGGQPEPAVYFIQSQEDESLASRSFATCDFHVQLALEIMLRENKSVRVRRVNT